MGLWNNGGFFSSVKGHVLKWWQFILRPVLRINNNGKTTQYTTPQYEMNSSQEQQILPASEQSMAPPAERSISQSETESQKKNGKAEKSNLDTGGGSVEDPMEVLRRINEEKEEARRKEIEAARRKASEEARIAAIMNANKVDVNAFIEAGKAAKEERQMVTAQSDAGNKQAEDLRRAQEIMERLNREAAEDEAKKQAEIEQAKQEAKKQYG